MRSLFVTVDDTVSSRVACNDLDSIAELGLVKLSNVTLESHEQIVLVVTSSTGTSFAAVVLIRFSASHFAISFALNSAVSKVTDDLEE